MSINSNHVNLIEHVIVPNSHITSLYLVEAPVGACIEAYVRKVFGYRENNVYTFFIKIDANPNYRTSRIIRTLTDLLRYQFT